jgi:hypothetical protein
LNEEGFGADGVGVVEDEEEEDAAGDETEGF